MTDVTGENFLFLCPLYFFPHSFSSSYFLPLFHCLISISLFPTSHAQVFGNTLSGRIGKVVASHAAVARLIPAEVALIYTMHEVLLSGGTAHEGGGCNCSTSHLDLQSLMPLFIAGCG